MASDESTQVEDFIARWAPSGGAELSNSQLFLTELCDLLELPRPEPFRPEIAENAYVFERPVSFDNGDGTTSSGRVDLYKRGCFVLESKQGSARREGEDESRLFDLPKKTRTGTAVRGTGGWDQAMRRAKAQAERYVRALPPDEGRPPVIIVVDVGHVLELYSEFTCTGGTYVPYPDPHSHRLKLDDLRREECRATLRLVWTNPGELDPTRRSARVTRDIADRLARLAKRLEDDGHLPEGVATFLMRCLFTMFAEDVGLLPERGFTALLESLRDEPAKFKPMAEDLWRAMKTGGFSAALRDQVLHFNGALFEEAVAIDLTGPQLALLIQACQADWQEVEPAIFGTLLERALSPGERHKLGAHYTPRAYVERLVLPTVVEPIRAEWDGVLTAAQALTDAGQPEQARAELEAFHDRLCALKVLDPACGSGNFLYVTLEHLKRLEGEVLDAARALGGLQLGLEHAGGTVGPHQLLGLEINPRAAAIAELVLWIGYLQWHLRTTGGARPPEPVIDRVRHIECRDAVLDYDRRQFRAGPDGRPVMRWDGQSTKEHPVTGQQVPDESRLVPVEEFINPRPATWPEADYVVGNPPFVGNWKMRQDLGEGYAETLRATVPDVPESCDYVMYWWERAAGLCRAGRLRAFGLITTNSITQTFSRRVVARHLNGELISAPLLTGATPATHRLEAEATTGSPPGQATPSGTGILPVQPTSASGAPPDDLHWLEANATSSPDRSTHRLEADAMTCSPQVQATSSGTGILPVQESTAARQHAEPPDTPDLFDPARPTDRREGAYLPHWAQAGATYFVTFRLADSLPRQAIERWLAEHSGGSPADTEEQWREPFRERIDALLDAGRGACRLASDDCATIVVDALRHFDGQRYTLWAWSVMPNHVHVVVQPMGDYRLAEIVHSWKSYTVKQLNKLTGRTGVLWQSEYFDHLIRSQRSFEWIVEYVLTNAANAGLADRIWQGGMGILPVQPTSASGTPPDDLHRLEANATTSPDRGTQRLEADAPTGSPQDRATPGGTGILPVRDSFAPLSIVFAIPDHPWVDSADGADVRIAMTVGRQGEHEGRLHTVTEEHPASDGTRTVAFRARRGRINADLTIGVDATSAVALKANDGLSCPGVKLHGSGFIVTPDQAVGLGLGTVPGLEQHIRPYRNGRDLTARPRGVMVIDLFGLPEGEVRQRFPAVYQWVLERVKPERDQNNRQTYRELWWVFGEPRRELRPALSGLHRYIATVETCRRRFFVFLPIEVLPDNKIVAIATDDPHHLGVLSSRIHVVWALAAGGRLGVGNDPVYVKSRCFDPFPFPDASDSLQERIRELGEQLDAHRRRQQEQHPELALTDMYNVLDKLRAGEALTAKDKRVHEQGLVSVLKQLHDELDAAVFAAYGWPADLSDEGILERLVALNRERATEERRGLIRWLRPEYQNPDGGGATQLTVDVGEEAVVTVTTARRPWPGRLSDQAQAVRAALVALGAAAEVETVARCFEGKLTANRRAAVGELLDKLADLGQVRRVGGQRYSAV